MLLEKINQDPGLQGEIEAALPEADASPVMIVQLAQYAAWAVTQQYACMGRPCS